MARIDKFIWAVRLCKTRSLAADLCKANKILLNDEEVKAGKDVKVGDKVTVKKNSARFSYEVIALLEKRVGAKLVSEYIIDVTPQEEIDKYEMYQLAQKQYRQDGLGRPSKKDRRKIDKFLKD
jgi:ribosome-associated heat shock protein Hsp15